MATTLPSTPMPTLALGDLLRIAEDFTDRADLHARSVHIAPDGDPNEHITVHVGGQMGAAALRVAHTMVAGASVVVKEYPGYFNVAVTGLYRGVPVRIYSGFWASEDRALIAAYTADAPADARLLDVLVGDAQVGA